MPWKSVRYRGGQEGPLQADGVRSVSRVRNEVTKVVQGVTSWNSDTRLERYRPLRRKEWQFVTEKPPTASRSSSFHPASCRWARNVLPWMGLNRAAANMNVVKSSRNSDKGVTTTTTTTTPRGWIAVERSVKDGGKFEFR